MKKIIFILTVIQVTNFCIAQENNAIVQFENFYKNESIVVDSLIKDQKSLTSIILGGLADTCIQLGKIITTDDQKEKQQGLANLVGTVLNVAAHLTNKVNTAKETTKSNDEKYEIRNIASVFDNLTNQLIEISDQQSALFCELPPMLSLLKKIPLSSRIDVTEFFLTNNKQIYQYLFELFVLINRCFNDTLLIAENSFIDADKDFFQHVEFSLK